MGFFSDFVESIGGAITNALMDTGGAVVSGVQSVTDPLGDNMDVVAIVGAVALTYGVGSAAYLAAAEAGSTGGGAAALEAATSAGADAATVTQVASELSTAQAAGTLTATEAAAMTGATGSIGGASMEGAAGLSTAAGAAASAGNAGGAATLNGILNGTAATTTTGAATGSYLPYAVGTGLTAAASLYGANKAAGATEDAANTAAGAQNAATELADKIYQQTRADFQPYADVGKAALPDFQKMVSGTYDWQDNPLAKYKTMVEQRASNRFAASRGLLTGGPQVSRLAEIEAKNTALGMGEQYQKILDALKLGTGASSSMGTAGQNNVTANQTAASNLGNIAVNQGNNQASLYAGQTGNLANIAATGLNAYRTFNPQPVNQYNIQTGVY